jgi:hypothetical protein
MPNKGHPYMFVGSGLPVLLSDDGKHMFSGTPITVDNTSQMR